MANLATSDVAKAVTTENITVSFSFLPFVFSFYGLCRTDALLLQVFARKVPLQFIAWPMEVLEIGLAASCFLLDNRLMKLFRANCQHSVSLGLLPHFCTSV